MNIVYTNRIGIRASEWLRHSVTATRSACRKACKLFLTSLHNSTNDLLIGYVIILILAAYIIVYGATKSHGWRFEQYSLFSIFIIIPIFLIDGIKAIIESLLLGEYGNGSEDITKVTVIIPSKNGGNTLEKTIIDLLRRFSPNQIIVASNGSTDNTCNIAKKYNTRLIEIPKAVGKIAAINQAIKEVDTPYTLLMDDDTFLGNAVIPTSILDEGRDGVAFRVLPVVTNWITAIQMYEYRKSMDIGRRFHNRTATVQNISGAIGLFNTRELIRQIPIHSGEFSGEDLQRTLLIHLAKKRNGVVLTDAEIYTETPQTVRSLYRQRTHGWFPGLYANIPHYIRILTGPRIPLSLKYDAFYNIILVIALDIFRVMALPALIFYPWYFLTLYISYFAIETLLYLRLGRTEPIWVIFVYPLFGLFSFITRIVAGAVYLYRRLAVHLNKSKKRDDYKICRLRYRIASAGIVIVLSASSLFSALVFDYNSASKNAAESLNYLNGAVLHYTENALSHDVSKINIESTGIVQAFTTYKP